MYLEQELPNGRFFRPQLTVNQLKYIVLRSLHLTVTSSLGDGDEELGRITPNSMVTKLEAVKTLQILPGLASAALEKQLSNPTLNESYELQPASDSRCEILILRHGDVICLPGTDHRLIYKHHSPEVQVKSTTVETDPADASLVDNGVEATPEGETGDEAVFDQTVTEVPRTQPFTQQAKSQPSATPQLTTHHSTVVQETPTADRTADITKNDLLPVATMLGPLEMTAHTETFSTARTGRSPTSMTQASLDNTDGHRLRSSPEVRVGARLTRKRPGGEPSSATEAEIPAEVHSAKRSRKAIFIDDKEDKTEHASPLDDINANPARTTYSGKARRRLGTVPETTPTKSTRSSQRSETATTVAAYEGETPRIATSNSAIKEASSAVKFLRKQGGALLSSVSVEERCNILCVRDGGLAKTLKVFQAIALGVPIVTDKWLFDSAKAGGFYDLSAYKPSVVQQEKDWDFKLERVWGTAQIPLKGYSVYFTPALKKTYTNFREIEQVCYAVGAKVVGRHSKHDKMIVLATDEEDPDAEKLIDNEETCYSKDLLTTSILRGNLDLHSDEFKIKRPEAVRKRAPRKST